MKRLIDALLGCVLLLMTGPLLLLITLAIKLESPGPALVSNDCIGLGGRRFQMLKFRTLPHDPSRNTASWRQKPTEVGKILRFTRLEVLPQLINVIRGEMSIIEPDDRRPFSISHSNFVELDLEPPGFSRSPDALRKKRLT